MYLSEREEAKTALAKNKRGQETLSRPEETLSHPEKKTISFSINTISHHFTDVLAEAGLSIGTRGGEGGPRERGARAGDFRGEDAKSPPPETRRPFRGATLNPKP